MILILLVLIFDFVDMLIKIICNIIYDYYADKSKCLLIILIAKHIILRIILLFDNKISVEDKIKVFSNHKIFAENKNT